MWVEIEGVTGGRFCNHVTSRKGRVSRNGNYIRDVIFCEKVTSRKGRVSRNHTTNTLDKSIGSRPVRGVWVEISETNEETAPTESRPVRGVWVEITEWRASSFQWTVTSRKGRVSRNQKKPIVCMMIELSRPVRGVWVEIQKKTEQGTCKRSRPVRGVWVEIWNFYSEYSRTESRPVRGVWIEISAGVVF